MQYNSRDFDKTKHYKFKGIRVRQPDADLIATGGKKLVVLPKNSKYRGDVLMISSGKSDYDTRKGMTICLVELYGIKPVTWMSVREVVENGYADTDLSGYCYMLRNPRRVIEIPARGHQGVFNTFFDKGDIQEYPFQEELKESFNVERESWLKRIINRVLTR